MKKPPFHITSTPVKRVLQESKKTQENKEKKRMKRHMKKKETTKFSKRKTKLAKLGGDDSIKSCFLRSILFFSSSYPPCETEKSQGKKNAFNSRSTYCRFFDAASSFHCGVSNLAGNQDNYPSVKQVPIRRITSANRKCKDLDGNRQFIT
ncbi:hypothetical protein J437_LFUL002657 [Ladona fulva]|uniref:Uncharacterized protein n=1 Tax=Ladona fulva TaxID=123851 RepID=A0A8K0JXM6_LADFU|nr:hypothetical protein J437_LFUL002657 [Ladona fulva]